jgi:tetratricopeptide (TPR) repeat protein
LALKSKHQKAVAEPDQFLTTSMKAVGWLEQNRKLVFGGLAVVLVIGVGYVGFGDYAENRRAAVTRKMSSVLEAEAADVVAEPPPLAEGEDEDARPLTFRTEKQRSETLVRRYKRLLAADGSSEMTAFAHLGLAGVYADLGKQEDAQKEYQEVLDSGVDALAPFAVEGLVYVYEARGKRREALAKIDELKTMQDGKFRLLANYHSARLDIADGKKTQALDVLRRLQRDLAESPELSFLREQTMALIGQLEAEGVMASAGSRDDGEGDAPAKKKGASKARGAKEGERREEEE